MLVARVRERRDHIGFRHDLQALIRSLEADGGHLPAPGCETRSPEALAHELEQLLSDSEITTGINPALRGSMGALVATLLWAAAATSTGCESVEDCMADASVENFEDLAAKGGMADCEVDAVSDQFQTNLTEEQQTDTIDELCAMLPGEITSYIETNFMVPNCTSDDDDDVQFDDDDTYKGVSF